MLQIGGDVNTLVKNAEPICSSLNIFRYMLLREPVSKMVSYLSYRLRVVLSLSMPWYPKLSVFSRVQYNTFYEHLIAPKPHFRIVWMRCTLVSHKL